MVKSIEADMGNHLYPYGYIVVQYLITGFGHPYSNNITVWIEMWIKKNCEW